VDSVDLRVEPGELVGLLGPNGAGKTTTFRLLMGMERADSGRIFLDGEDITHLPLHRRGRLGLGFLAQEPSVFRKMTVADNLLAVLELMGEEDRLDELLTEFELAHLRCSMAYKLSGGERRRTEIARAMAARPKYLLLDEPFAGIDPISVAELQEMLGGLRARGVGALIADHNVRETLAITDRAYILHEGRVLAEGPPKVIAADPIVRRYYLGEGFRL
jgi:lipopolysaccharide export system ATP-binding protein